jgi:prevent-host-death family protein
MSTHSIAEAGADLSALIDRALAGEPVVIARDGQPVVALQPISRAGRRVTPADIDWLRGRRVGVASPTTDAGTFMSRMRDDDER